MVFTSFVSIIFPQSVIFITTTKGAGASGHLSHTIQRTESRTSRKIHPQIHGENHRKKNLERIRAGILTFKCSIPKDLFDNGVNVLPSRVAALAGRLLRGVDDRGLLEQEMEDIVARDARALRFSGVEQAKL
jgi:hypothetical protein